ncbi:hypothetical protein FVE85_4450 [Porphyridium purpureum]|uniref:Small ribosomal subunit protein mS23 conserved domain-containing protein n=1 Tax=Porphyridium purpureum TaxID=35688 RepID=A0A5J4YK60_PORPP|nr:hypothetical protein FVE85_4450 [Porphyridium purpureum]|eukprot:POR4021..scf297_16
MPRPKPFLKNIYALVKAGVIEKPLWMSAHRMAPQAVISKKPHVIPELQFASDVLRRELLEKRPDLRRHPYDLMTTDKKDSHVAEKFAQRQEELMKEHSLSKDEAFHRAERELHSQLYRTTEYGVSSGLLNHEDKERLMSGAPMDKDEFSKILFEASLRDAKTEESVLRNVQDALNAKSR